MRKLEIYKTYGNDYTYEEGVVFEIYTDELVLYDSIVTDINGYGYIELPYGNYYIKQVNSIDGYMPVDDFMINIDDSNYNYVYKLNDKEVNKPKVNNPSTYDNIYKYFILMVIVIINIVSLVIYKRHKVIFEF